MKEARFQASLRLIPATQLFTMVDVVLLVLYFWPDADHRFLLIWASITVINSCFWWYYARRASRPPLHPRAGRERLLIIHAVVEASVFSSFFFMVFPSLSPGKAVVLGAFAMGLLAAGGFSKMPLPRAAVVFVAFLGLGSGLAVGRSTLPSIWIPESLLVAFGVSIGLLVFRMSDIFDAWVGAQEDLDRQNTLISHLLEDFEESASEGLWEADANGRLTFVSPRLTDLFAIPAEELVGRRLVPWAEWAPVLEKGAAFRNLVVPVEIGRLRWWSLSAKPTKDARGNVTGWRGVGSDITGVRLQELEMVRLSRYDNLTGLLNRNSFRTLLDEPFRHNASPDLWCLVLIDLVDFKDVNESRGHLFGDALLVAVADRLKEAATGTIQLARLDGDEFALWGPLTRSVREMKKSLEYLLKHLAEPFPVAGIRHEAWFRLGVSFAPQDGGTADQWLRSADLALRTAKEQGRNQIVFFAPPMMESYRSRNTLREDLSGALSRGELSLAFQPLVDLRLGSMSGFEVLVRWDHPVRGRISPSDFIPLAEETELILTLGLWVLKQACLEARHWPPPLSISVNVSGVQLRSASLAADVAAILNEVGLAPQRLILEVTESALIKNDAALGRTFDSLKKMGIRLALDDFGTGFSALSYLQDFPFDKLKIDQSFVRPLSSSVNSPSLLAAIVSLAQSLDLSTTAEGIEEESHLSVLRSLGCDEGQGYYFSPPVTASEVPQLLLGFPVVSR